MPACVACSLPGAPGGVAAWDRCSSSRSCCTPDVAAAALEPLSHDAGSGVLQYGLLEVQACGRLQLAMTARRMCAAYLQAAGGAGDRARDVLFLDIALATHARTVLEGSLDDLSAFLDTTFASGRAFLSTAPSRVASIALLQHHHAVHSAAGV